jgi:hypothetical protein
VAAAGLLAGCSTTMQEAARLQLNSARIRASQVSTRVTRASSVVRVRRIAVLSSGGRSDFVVDVASSARRPLSDLPISVGYASPDGARTYLNASATLDYYQSHLPVIAARGRLTWVFGADRAVPRGVRPFALIGATPATSARPTRPLPRITATTTATAATSAGHSLRIVLRNASSVPQYQLQVYAVAARAGGYVAAGSETVEHLGTGSTRTIELPLLGSLSRATVQVEALPTIFQ